MDPRYPPLTIPLLVSAVVTGALGLYAWHRRGAHRAAVPLAGLMFACAIWSAGSALEGAATDYASRYFWRRVSWLGTVSISMLWFVFAVYYVGQARWLTRRRLVLLAVVPALALLSGWTNEWHSLIWTRLEMPESGVGMLRERHGMMFGVHTVYAYALLLSGAALILR